MPVTAPTITGGTTRSITLNENLTAAGIVSGTDLDGDALHYYIVGGADKKKFKIDANTGALTFVSAPDFEKPTDGTKNSAGILNGTNTYEVIVQVEDGVHGTAGTLKSATQTITVTIADVAGNTITGTASDDAALGVSGPVVATAEADTINALAGNDTLDGGIGADIMNGGLGNDTYKVDNVGDQTNENAGEGTDLVESSVSYVLTNSNVENLTLIGTAALNATGNGLGNVLTGNIGSNILDGGAGNDTMIGGIGNDVYRVDSTSDVVTELDGQGTDRVESSVTWTLGNFVENLTLTGTNAVNGTGNSLKNTIIGNGAVNTLDGAAGDDTLNGFGGADTLIGGGGNDTFIVDFAGVTVTEALGGGNDTIKSSVTYTASANVEYLTLTGSAAINGTGNAMNNTITGNSGANTLSGLDGVDILKGGSGIDTMIGGLGSDTYYVDNSTETVTENLNEGNDTVITSGDGTVLWANVENLTLSGSALVGTGNTLDNIIIGTSKGNTLIGLAGNDTLIGGSGIDTMTGGLGDDTYSVDNAADTVVENASEGTDTVNTSITIPVLWANVENVNLTGSGTINVNGNSLDNVINGNIKANMISGGLGNDTLDGGRGIDTLTGGAGNDTYYLSDADIVVEAAGEGTDTVFSSLTGTGYTLTSNVENLTLTGTFNIDGTGNALANVITGNQGWNTLAGDAGNDTINGGAGSDIITGGAGVDTMTGGTEIDMFKFLATTDSGTSVGNYDQITDFSFGEVIDLSAIDAKASLATDQAFVLDTNGVLAEGEILMTRSGNVITLSIDTDSTAGANMVIQLTVDSTIPTGVLTIENFIL